MPDNFNPQSNDKEQTIEDLQLRSTIQEARHQFDLDFEELLERNNSSGRVMFVFVRRTLKAFRLNGLYSEAYFLNGAYLIGVRKINTGELIHNTSTTRRKLGYHLRHPPK